KMPTYEYQCGACGAKFELFQRMSDDPIKICPQCGKSTAKRLMSTGVGVVFKGSGFYVTDYRDASYAKAESADRTNATHTSAPSSKSTKSTDSTVASSDHSAKSTSTANGGSSGTPPSGVSANGTSSAKPGSNPGSTTKAA
ncbi:MAG: zinc ribbon domain-containing protein, partial [Thermoguttaceae bacterium]|nr:zinc ribbon domain-containing protein [Thermoguttaceae bacterium]